MLFWWLSATNTYQKLDIKYYSIQQTLANLYSQYKLFS